MEIITISEARGGVGLNKATRMSSSQTDETRADDDNDDGDTVIMIIIMIIQPQKLRHWFSVDCWVCLTKILAPTPLNSEGGGGRRGWGVVGSVHKDSAHQST